jgi:hypothetical protein
VESTAVLTKEWYTELERASSSNFVNLPVEFQLRGYDYDYIAKSYFTFFNSESNTRQDKLALAKKFLKFIRNINKNRAKEELGEDFFLCFQYFMENFSDLMAKNDSIALETLSVMQKALDKSQMIEDIINVDELERRVKNLEKVKAREEIIEVEFDDVTDEYLALNQNEKERNKFLLESGINSEEVEVDLNEKNMDKEPEVVK